MNCVEQISIGDSGNPVLMNVYYGSFANNTNWDNFVKLQYLHHTDILIPVFVRGV